MDQQGDQQGELTAVAVGSGTTSASSTWEVATDEGRLRLGDVASLVRRQQRRLVRQARQAEKPSLRHVLLEHLRCDLERVVVVEESWPAYELVNVQIALEHWLDDGREHELVGLARTRHREFGLSDLLHQDADDPYDHGPVVGTPSWTTQAAGPDGAVRRALRAGLFLTTEGDERVALLLLAMDPDSGRMPTALHVAAEREETAAAVAARIRALATEHNVFRGQVLSFGGEMFERGAALHFHTRPQVSSDDVILPADVLATVRQQVVGVAHHRERLLAAGQHLKRGLLLHGPPGVGKTHTVRHLMSELTDVTIVNLSGDALQLIREACSVARALQPAMVVIEDVDLIAQDRDRYGGQTPLLFELLNQMDGLAADADVVFLLTTNRADLLEAALAARPGRVDQAVALELPDAEGRRRLVELYRGRLDLDTSRLDAVVARTEGVTASFLKELLRRAALRAAEDDADPGDGQLRVTADHLDAALSELLDGRNAMTRVMLGSGAPATAPVAGDEAWDD